MRSSDLPFRWQVSAGPSLREANKRGVFVGLMIKDRALALDMADEIPGAAAVSHGRAVVREGARG